MDPSPIRPFSAVLLAGGRSTRMGRDKASLVVGEEPLWRRQLATLKLIHPAALWISGREDGPYSDAEVPVVLDAIPDLGPLGGIAAALQRTEFPLVLFLAIDLPVMTAAFLNGLVDEALASGKGVVPNDGDFFQPLVAVYPREALAVAIDILQEEDRSMQRFVRELLEKNLAQTHLVHASDRHLFQNLNRPEDLDFFS